MGTSEAKKYRIPTKTLNNHNCRETQNILQKGETMIFKIKYNYHLLGDVRKNINPLAI